MIKRLFIFILVGIACFFMLNDSVKLTFSGNTMGTTFSITTYGVSRLHYFTLNKLIHSRLSAINQSMSTYIPDSEISQFNELDYGVSMTISSDFYTVLDTAKYIYKISHSAWDPTIKPLVDRWGFSEKNEMFVWPSKKEIKLLRKELGFGYVELIPPNKVKKNRDNLFLDLSSIAKGYGVDEIIAILKMYTVDGAMVEIGGEVRVIGTKPSNEPWQIGLNSPDASSSKYAFSKVITLNNNAVATSGDYRNYFDYEGESYSHIIDPRTGFPINGDLHSISVIAPSCMIADALATACLVLGRKEAELLEKQFSDIKLIFVQDKLK
jgi:FAD:protein FMN transferase